MPKERFVRKHLTPQETKELFEKLDAKRTPSSTIAALKLHSSVLATLEKLNTQKQN